MRGSALRIDAANLSAAVGQARSAAAGFRAGRPGPARGVRPLGRDGRGASGAAGCWEFVRGAPPHPQPLSREGRGEQAGATGGTPPVLDDAAEVEPGTDSSNGTFGPTPESPLTAGDDSYHSDVRHLAETAAEIACSTPVAESNCDAARSQLPASAAREKTGESISAGPVATSPRPPAAQPLTPSPSPARGEGSRRERNEFRSTSPKPARPKRIWYGGHPPLPLPPGPPPIVIPCRFTCTR